MTGKLNDTAFFHQKKNKKMVPLYARHKNWYFFTDVPAPMPYAVNLMLLQPPNGSNPSPVQLSGGVAAATLPVSWLAVHQATGWSSDCHRGGCFRDGQWDWEGEIIDCLRDTEWGKIGQSMHVDYICNSLISFSLGIPIFIFFEIQVDGEKQGENASA